MIQLGAKPFGPWDPHAERRVPTPISCLLASTFVLRQATHKSK